MLVRTLVALTALTLPAVPACLQLGPDAATTDVADVASHHDVHTADGVADAALTLGALSITAPIVATETPEPRASVIEDDRDVVDGLDAGAVSTPAGELPLDHWVAVFEARHEVEVGAVLDGTEPGMPAPPEGWFGVIHGGDLVLANEAPESWWGGPAAFLERGEDHGRYVIERAVREASLPDSHRAWLGREVRLFDRRGEVCVARVDGLALRSELIDDNKALWGDEAPFGDAPDRAGQDPDVAWDDGGHMLLGALTTVRGDCAGAVFATAGERPAPTVLAPAKADGRLKRQALAAFRALPAWAEIQADYEATLRGLEETHAPASWDRYAETRPTVARFRAKSGREVVLVTADSVDGCGSPGGQLSAVFEVTREGRKVALKPVYAQPWAPTLTGFVDLDGDGVLEGIGDGTPAAIHTLTPAEAPIRGAVEIPDLTDYGCPC